MARMPLGDEVSVENGKKKRRNSGVSAQAAHEIGTAQAPAETLEKYSNRYGVTIEWLVTGDHVGFQRNIGSFLFPKIAPLHKDMFFLKGCFPDRRTWLLNRQVIAQEGYRIISPAWLDPWLVCAVFLGTMHHEDDDVEYRTTRALKDISESLKKMTDEIRYLRPRDDVEVAPDAE